MDPQTPPQFQAQEELPQRRNNTCIVVGCSLFTIFTVGCLGIVLLIYNRAKNGFLFKPNRMSCVRNLKQLGIAAALYENENNSMLPPASSWMDSLSSYVGDKTQSISEKQDYFKCPLVMSEKNTDYGYAMNSKLSKLNTSAFKGNPTLTLLFYDSSNVFQRNASDPVTSLPNAGRHRQTKTYSGNNGVFLDGHASFLLNKNADTNLQSPPNPFK